MHKDQKLRIDIESFDGEKAYALYSTFYVENVTSNYRLSVSGFSGTAGEHMLSNTCTMICIIQMDVITIIHVTVLHNIYFMREKQNEINIK